MRAIVLAALLSLPVPGTVATPCLLRPHPGAVVEPFVPPACRWCPGHRGVEIDVHPGDPVQAMASGRVSFSGSVAGTLYVTVDHGRGLRTTYGRLTSTAVRSGQMVAQGTVVGAAGATLMVTVRRDGVYQDPEPLLGSTGWRARLVPVDGTPRRPARPGPLRCPVRP